jgi:hypothetical protein
MLPMPLSPPSQNPRDDMRGEIRSFWMLTLLLRVSGGGREQTLFLRAAVLRSLTAAANILSWCHDPRILESCNLPTGRSVGLEIYDFECSRINEMWIK